MSNSPENNEVAQVNPNVATNSSNIKQVIVMRTDTAPPMRKGKMVSQGGHGVIGFIFGSLKHIEGRRYEIEFTEAEEDWKNGNQTKITLKVDSEDELLDIHCRARKAGLKSHLVLDLGLTEFAGSTYTCVTIGPDLKEKIDVLTGHLKPL